MRTVLVISLFLLSLPLRAEIASFELSDIRLQGLQRVSAGTVFNELPVNVGDSIDGVTVRQLIRGLFRTGYFDDITMARDGDALIITLQERPAIEAIQIEGNKAIKDESLFEGLAEQGLREGEIFKQSTLERVAIELERQYVAQGRYGSGIETKVDKLPRNRVAISIDIVEGKSSGIRHINFVGATVFEQDELLDELELKHPTLLGFIRGKDKYSREKLQGDIETLESYYQDRGYVEFRAASTQVSVAPDRSQVYLTINVEEGSKYTVNEVDLVGELGEVKPEQLEALFVVQPGQIFSRALVTATEERITGVLGNSGYTFAEATGIPEVHDDGSVDVKFMVNTGQRAYVRRISYAGNATTQDAVLRREMRQLEGAWASTRAIDLSKIRLERLGYFQEVNVETPAVPGRDDQIDVEFSVKEQPTGSLSGTLGYSEYSGLILGASFQETNVGGTGNSFGLGVSWSKYMKSINYNFFDPYFTADGISRGYNLSFRETDYGARNLARYSTDSLGGGVNFGFPLSETQRLQFSLTVEQTDITQGFLTAQEISSFVNAEGNEFLNYKLESSWRSTTLNRGMFPTRGKSHVGTLEVAIPGSDLEFYRVSYKGDFYFPVPLVPQSHLWALRLRAKLGYGAAFGATNTYPFYEHFFAGGFGSVRGFENSTLGPRTQPIEGLYYRDARGDPFGGNALVELSGELIFPLPLVEQIGQIRSLFFVDIGNVFNTDCPPGTVNCFDLSLEELRYSTGLAITWLTAMGPMSFALTFPLNTGPFDEVERFSFELGKTF